MCILHAKGSPFNLLSRVIIIITLVPPPNFLFYSTIQHLLGTLTLIKQKTTQLIYTEPYDNHKNNHEIMLFATIFIKKNSSLQSKTVTGNGRLFLESPEYKTA